MIINKINKKNCYLINSFLDIAGDTLETFTYFNKRTLSSLDNHLVTFIGIIDNQVVSYGHLDKDDNKIWLGIAVAEKFKNRGLGNQMMNELILYVKENNLQKIHLSVSNTNYIAYNLYRKFGFKIFKKTEEASEYFLII